MPSAAEQLLDLLAPRFAFITVANGYTEPLRRITRAEQTPFQMQDLPALNYWASNARLEENRYKYQVWQLELIINAYTATRDEPFVDTASRLADEIMIACQRVTATPAIGDRWDGNLYNAEPDRVGEIVFDSAAYAIGEGGKPYCGTVISGLIRYNVAPGAFNVLLPM